MKRILILLFLLSITFSKDIAADYCCYPEDYSFYIKLGSGISFSECANITAPRSAWAPAVQSYNSKLGNRPIADLSIGCELRNIVDLEVGISCRSTFQYRKFQTPLYGGDSYMRAFDLDVIPILFSVKLLGQSISSFNWDVACGKIYPVIGVGVGVSNLFITNFRTTCLPSSGSSYPFASFSAENQYTHRRNFTYTALIGLEYNNNNCWAITTGYRWFDAGQFKGPRFQRAADGAAVDLYGQEWKMHFRSNELFVEFKIYL